MNHGEYSSKGHSPNHKTQHEKFGEKKQRMLINPTTGNLEPLDNLLVDANNNFSHIEQILEKGNVEESMRNDILDSDNESAVSDDQVEMNDSSSEVSSSILLGTRSVPKVCLNYKNRRYGLFSNVPVEKNSDTTLQHLSIKPELSFEPISAVFKLIRESLQLYSPTMELANSELVIKVAELDLELQEDNLYNKNITLQDIFSIYRSLFDSTSPQDRGSSDIGEDDLILNFNITTKKRFLNRYNELVELVDNHGNLNHVFKFSNSSGDPVLLDDDEKYSCIDQRIVNKHSAEDGNDSDSEIEILG